MGIIYVGSEAQAFIEALEVTLTDSTEEIEKLKQGSQEIYLYVESGNLLGMSYTKQTEIFREYIIPIMEQMKQGIECIFEELNIFKEENEKIVHEGYLDENNLKQQIMIKRSLRESIEYSLLAIQGVSFNYTSPFIENITLNLIQSLRNNSEILGNEITQLEEKLDKLMYFYYNTSHLFHEALSNIRVAMQGALIMNHMHVQIDGTYSYPIGTDKSWFYEVKAALYDKQTIDYKIAINQLLEFDEIGNIESINVVKVQNWLIAYKHNLLSDAECAALKTFCWTIVGYGVNKWELNSNVELICQILAQVTNINDWSIFGFRYYKDKEYYITMQDSMQSWFGFTDFYDEVGPLLGMDLDTEIIRFELDGKEYRFQVWKGTYGSGMLAGGEQGWYVADLDNPNLLDQIADGLGIGDLVPVATGEDRIYMTNTIFYNSDEPLLDTNDMADYAEDGGYWNLTTSVNLAGRTKNNLVAKGELSIDDEEVCQGLYEEIMRNDAFKEVSIDGNTISYTW